MSLIDQITYRKVKLQALGSDGKSVKTMKIGGHKLSYKKGEEVIHGYRELFLDRIYTFQSDNPSPLILDCGAHIGLSVIFFKSLFPNSRIIAFEPDAANIELLTANAQQFNNITIEQKAIWIHNNGVSFAATGDMSSHINTNATTVSMASARLYDYLDQPVDMLKIDIEGAEIDVLKDCKDRLHNVKNMFVEFHGNNDEPERLETLLGIFREANLTYYIKEANDWATLPFVNMSSAHGWDVQLNIFCRSKK